MRRSISKNLTCMVCMLGPIVGLSAGTFVWNGSAGDNNWKNSSNYDGGALPKANDIVQIPDGVTVVISSDDSDSWELASSLTRIAPQGDGSRIVFYVKEGVAKDFAAGITREIVWDSQVGKVEKTGSGTLCLCGNSGYYDYFVNEFSVIEGVVDCSKISKTEYLKTIRIAKDAIFITPANTFWVAEILGDGEFQSQSSGWDTRTYGGTVDQPSIVEALIGSKVAYSGSSYTRFMRKDNQMASFSVYGGVSEIFDIGKAGQPSGTGKNWNLDFGSMGIGVIRYVGTVDTVTDKGLRIKNETSDAKGVGTFDAGPHGGIEFNEAWGWGAGTWGRPQILAQYRLIGSNVVPCRINGKIGLSPSGGKTGILGIVKKGSGAWHLSNHENFFDSTIDIQEGELVFDSIKEKGEKCSLGTASDLKDPDICGDYGSAPAVPYAFRIGNSSLSYPGAGLATLRSKAAMKSSCTTRPIALAGDGRLDAGSHKLVFRGVSSIVSGISSLVLDGDNPGVTNVFHDITDGGVDKKIGVIKDGEGTWMLTGTNTWTGPLVVNGGKLILKRPSNIYSWYRLVIKDSCRIDWPGDGYDCYKLGRIGLFDKDGYRRNIGLEFVSELPQNSGVTANDHIPSFLEAGQFGWGMPERYEWGEMYLSLKHVCSTGWASDNSCLFMIRQSVKSHYADDPDKYVYIDMRLPEGTPEIAYYDLAAIYNKGNYLELYNIKTWTLLGSTDGIVWDELHSINDVMSDDPNQKMKLPSKSSYWMAQDASTEWDTVDTIHNTDKLQEIPSRRTGGLPPFFDTGISSVTVANGAVLEVDGDVTLSKFRVSYGSVPGIVKGFTLTEQCEIDISDIPEGVHSVDVPIAFDGVSVDSIKWSVKVDGELSQRFKPVVQKGRLRLLRSGLVIVVK